MSNALRRLNLRRWQRSRLPRGAIDVFTSRRVVGWAFAPSGDVEVQAWLGDFCIARTYPGVGRPDVAHAFPGHGNALLSGFALDLPAQKQDALDVVPELQIVAVTRTGMTRGKRVLGRASVVAEGLMKRLAEAPDSGLKGPFPKDVIDAIAAVWPDECTNLQSEEGQAAFVERLLWIMRTPPLNTLPAFVDYARYLALTLAHCRFVERHFPVTNALAREGASDFHCKPNSVDELFAIVHQLYVLKNWGVDGDFAEFGCFKGYSSAMLSFACSQLGLKMHVFDSFSGLPEAEGSGYEAGQFAGSLDEVKANIARLGSLSSVEFHPGFFADSLRDYSPPPLLCLWMDVDLEVSARDLMVVAEQLDPRSSLFSHECNADIFQAGQIVTAPGPDNPVYPLVARHEELGRTLTGHYVAGYTGAFWPKRTGTPVLGTAALKSLMREFDPSSAAP